MLKFDFTKILEPKTVTKAAPRKSKKKTSKKEAPTYIGDPNRIATLPDVVTAEFLSLYSDSLDLVLTPHVRYGSMTISEASRYKEAVIENIFGNQYHLGIFHYLQEKNTDGKSDKELTTYAETLLTRGYHIKNINEQFWLVNPELTQVANVTGPAPTAREVEELVFDESSAHLFLPDDIAGKIGALARNMGQDANVLAVQGNLDVLLSKIKNEILGGYILNYNALRNILASGTTYRTNTDGASALDLYREGYRIGSRIAYPVSQHTELVSKNGAPYRLMPVNPDVNKNIGVNKTQLQVIVNRIRRDLLSDRIQIQDIQEVKNLYSTFGILVEAPEGNTYLDSYQKLSMTIANGTDDYKQQLLEDLACLVVTEMLLLGNSKFNLQSWSIVGAGALYSYVADDYFDGITPEQFIAGEDAPVLDSFLYGITEDLAVNLVKVLPKDYLNKLSAYELDMTEYPREFMTLAKMFEDNKAAILGAI